MFRRYDKAHVKELYVGRLFVYNDILFTLLIIQKIVTGLAVLADAYIPHQTYGCKLYRRWTLHQTEFFKLFQYPHYPYEHIGNQFEVVKRQSIALCQVYLQKITVDIFKNQNFKWFPIQWYSFDNAFGMCGIDFA